MPFVEKKLDGFLTAENADPPASPCPSASAEVSRPARLALPVRHRLRLQAIAGRARMAGVVPGGLAWRAGTPIFVVS